MNPNFESLDVRKGGAEPIARVVRMKRALCDELLEHPDYGHRGQTKRTTEAKQKQADRRPSAPIPGSA